MAKAKTKQNGSSRKKLAAKREIFCKEYIIDFNAQNAAMRAGYSKNGAGVTGHEILKDIKVQKRIKQLMRDRTKRVEVTADKVVNELAKIAFSNIADFQKASQQNSLSGVIISLSRDQAACIHSLVERATKDCVRVEFKFYDKLKALELLGRHLGMFTENVNVTSTGVDNAVSVDDLGLTLPEKQRLLKAIRETKASRETIVE